MACFIQFPYNIIWLINAICFFNLPFKYLGGDDLINLILQLIQNSKIKKCLLITSVYPD